MALDEFEIKMLKVCCEANENIILSVREPGTREIHSYRSRFLDFKLNENYLIIDEPSAEKKKSKPISKNQVFEAFFQYNVGAGFRYIFDSKVVNRVMFKIGESGIYAFKIILPTFLKDGERREYFRVPTEMTPQIIVKCNIYKDGKDEAIISEYTDKPEIFSFGMNDLSGGGFSIKSLPKSAKVEIEVDDILQAKFKLERRDDEIVLWAKIKHKRRYKETNKFIWGAEFLGVDKNRFIKSIRNKIMHFVIKRQRDILS